MTVRRIAALLASSCAVVLLAGCGTSVDTAKQTFKRTTVPASEATSTSEPTDTSAAPSTGTPGKPVDAVYAPDKLRMVFPCGLVDTQATMGQYGTPAQPELQDYNKCFFSIDGDSDVPRAYVTLDEHTYVADDDPTTQVAGLLTTTDDTISDGTCFVEGIIQRDPDRAITLQVHWDGGDACDLGKKLLASVVAKIKDGSSQYQLAPGYLVNLDPCAALSADEATAALGAAAAPDTEPDLHDCNWDATDSGQSVRVSYAIAPDPAKDTSSSPKPVKVNTVDAVSEKSTTGNTCTVSWKQRPVDNADVDKSLPMFEVVEVEVDAGSSGKDSCAAALTAAKSAQPKLPTP